MRLPSKERSPQRSLFRAVVRWALNQLYTRFAFAYDFVSAIVSRGEWRAWTRAAIPFIHGTRVLEIAHGAGNLHLDLYDAGFTPIGIDLSPNMGALTQNKFRAQGRALPRLARTRVQNLPFSDASFSSLVMTFPPALVYDLDAMQEMWRVLETGGKLIWVESPSMRTRDVWSRLIQLAFLLTGGWGNPYKDSVETLIGSLHEGALLEKWSWRDERVIFPHGQVHVFIGIKNENLN